MTRTIRLEPFPLRHAMLSSHHKWVAENKSRGYDKYAWHREGKRRYPTVQLALVDRPPQHGWPRKHGWMLAYDGVPNTGPFDTRLEAIKWFIGGGR